MVTLPAINHNRYKIVPTYETTATGVNTTIEDSGRAAE